MTLNPEVWGPKYWFVLHSIAYTYPEYPNETTKKKYYDFIQNLPLFIPHQEIGDNFVKVLDKFPVTPYLDNRMSFMKWMNFIHNKINLSLGKDFIEFEDGVSKYKELYRSVDEVSVEKFKYKKHIIYASLTVSSILVAYFLYNKEY